MAPELPIELKYMILDYLCGDKRSISTCSMLSQTWQYPARTLLFHSISLRVENVPTKPHRRFPRAQVPDYDAFVKTIPSYLRHAVRSLTMSGKALPRAREKLKNLVEFYGYDGEADDDKAEKDGVLLIELQESLWTTLRLDVVLRTVQRLPLLQTLSLSDFVLKPTEVSDAPLVALESITLRSLATHGEDDILRLFDALSADEITLDVVSMSKGGEPPGVVQDPLGLVFARSLDICHSALRFSRAVCNLAPPLTCLTVSIRTMSELKGLQRVLSRVAPTLKRFALNLYDAFRVTSPYAFMSLAMCVALAKVNLAGLESLTHLAFGVIIGHHRYGSEETLHAITGVLSSLPHLVPHLTLRLVFPSFVLDYALAQPWSALEQVLRDRGGMQHLEFAITHLLGKAKRKKIPEDAQRAIELALLDKFISVKDILTISFPTFPRSR